MPTLFSVETSNQKTQEEQILQMAQQNMAIMDMTQKTLSHYRAMLKKAPNCYLPYTLGNEEKPRFFDGSLSSIVSTHLNGQELEGKNPFPEILDYAAAAYPSLRGIKDYDTLFITGSRHLAHAWEDSFNMLALKGDKLMCARLFYLVHDKNLRYARYNDLLKEQKEHLIKVSQASDSTSKAQALQGLKRRALYDPHISHDIATDLDCYEKSIPPTLAKNFREIMALFKKNHPSPEAVADEFYQGELRPNIFEMLLVSLGEIPKEKAYDLYRTPTTHYFYGEKGQIFGAGIQPLFCYHTTTIMEELNDFFTACTQFCENKEASTPVTTTELLNALEAQSIKLIKSLKEAPSTPPQS